MEWNIGDKKVVIGLLAILSFLPFLIEHSYTMYITNLVGIYMILGMGLNIVMGYAGQISILNAGFAGIGAYVTALSIVKLQVPVVVALPMAGLVTAAFGFLIGFPALRLGSHYLAMATLACNQSIQLIMIHWKEVTMGAAGISIPGVSIGPLALDSNHRLYFLVFPITLGLIYLSKNIIKSKLGRSLIAIRDSEIAAQAMGVNLTKYKTIAFAISGFYAGVAGSLLGLVLGYVSHESFGLTESVYHIALMVIGGTGTLSGPLLGASFYVIAPEFMYGFIQYKVFVFAVLTLIFIIFMPKGLSSLMKKASVMIEGVLRRKAESSS
jgi:branched-chain amino acid transport system permease protein